MGFSSILQGVGVGLLGMVLLAGCVNTSPSAPGSVRVKTERAHSELWGRGGELWLQGGRLPDFSFAGYRHGEEPIPDYPVATSVDKFGANGRDEADDTEAFLAALEATESGAIYVPPGRYIISKVLRVTRPGVVLRGAGEGRTTLFFPTPLEAIEPSPSATTGGQPTSNYSWAGGFVRFQGSFRSKVLTPISADASRGERRITVEKPETLTVGQVVEVFVTDTPEDTLAKHLYSDDAGDVSNIRGRTTASLMSRVTAIDGHQVQLERWLRFDLRAEWQPVVRAFEPTVSESGVEDLTFEFPATPYGGHFSEQGYNPVAFVNVAHCWARRLTFINPDSGPMVGGVFNTVSDVVFESERPADKHGNQGHHGIYMGYVGDHLFTRFEFRMRFVHDISVSRSGGVVVSHGKGVNLCFDNHKRAPYETLYTMLDLGDGMRPWHSGGGLALGKHAGARTTFWNLRAAGPLAEPSVDFGPWSMNLIGVNLGRPGVVDPTGVWREFTAGETVHPADLHQAQLERRLRRRR